MEKKLFECADGRRTDDGDCLFDKLLWKLRLREAKTLSMDQSFQIVFIFSSKSGQKKESSDILLTKAEGSGAAYRISSCGSMTGILKQLKWESLKKRRKDSRLIMLYKGLKGAASIPTNDLVPPIRRTRNHHSLAFQIPMAETYIQVQFLPPDYKRLEPFDRFPYLCF